ncbi:coth protein-domain-containing protein [Cunninghamella echinulata]|nr:coth protein-domain-containing protein [Cunninghamella echinulata]
MVSKIIFIAFAVTTVLAQNQSPTTTGGGEPEDFTFKVITLPSHMVNNTNTPADIGVALVDINRYYPLSASDDTPILYSTTVPNEAFHGNQTLRYKYVKFQPDSQNVIDMEPFIRTFPLTSSSSSSTLNEFYGRERTIRDTKSFPSIVDNNVFHQDFHRAPDQLHRFNEIVTIHLTAPEEDVQNMHENYLDDIDVIGDMTYISSNEIKQFYGCKFAVTGRSSRHFTKLPYSVTLNKGDYLGGYRKLKLRSSASDPTYIREKMAYELLYATGRPATLVSHVRLFINDQPAGLFLLAEKYSDEWLGMEFNQGLDPFHNGVLYKPKGVVKKENMAADLSYHQDYADYDDIYKVQEPSEINDVGMQDLIEFTQFVDEQIRWQTLGNNTLDSSVSVWEKKFNVQGFLTNMALEFLLASWDSYIENTQNYYLYKQHYGDQVFDWIGWDYDFILGNGPVSMDRMLEGNYRNFSGMVKQPLTRATLMVPTYQKSFELQLRLIAEKLLHPSVSFPILDDWKEFLKQDADWDQSLPRLRTGHSGSGFTSIIHPGSENNSTKTDSDGKKHEKDSPMSTPIDFEMRSAMDFFFRLNTPIPIEKAIDGPLTKSSLWSMKEFIQRKVDNVLNFSKQ